ncbi:hypothetical protein GGX14DRAFT_385717 [Mycena pura]|uniref:Uncharacterized protein n=1 Tax=Mycena pura TaxID=153505 RepID=A0AAD7E3R3_9AGAR|nr:hypothetical protein GGX14DRAFT_385717 [Mycena pura]
MALPPVRSSLTNRVSSERLQEGIGHHERRTCTAARLLSESRARRPPQFGNPMTETRTANVQQGKTVAHLTRGMLCLDNGAGSYSPPHRRRRRLPPDRPAAKGNQVDLLDCESDTIEDLCAGIFEQVHCQVRFLLSNFAHRNKQTLFVLDTSRFTSQVHFAPSLRAVLTNLNPSTIKVGCGHRLALSTLATIYDDNELRKVSAARDGLFLELGLHAKLKGAITNQGLLHHALVGTIFERSFIPLSTTESWNDAGHSNRLHDGIECIWKAHLALASRDSVGLPLTLQQAREDGRLFSSP